MFITIYINSLAKSCINSIEISIETNVSRIETNILDHFPGKKVCQRIVMSKIFELTFYREINVSSGTEKIR